MRIQKAEPKVKHMFRVFDTLEEYGPHMIRDMDAKLVVNFLDEQIRRRELPLNRRHWPLDR